MSQANKTIEQKLDELRTQVAWFDGDEFVLAEAIDRFKQAEKLATEIERDLSSFKNTITVLKQRFDEAE